MLSDDIAEVLRAHRPSAPATPADVDAFERKHGVSLDPDLRAFYMACNGADLFRTEDDLPYRILPLEKIVTAGVAVFGTDDRLGPPPPSPANIFAFCDLQDGNYLAFEVGQQPYRIIDVFHETYPSEAEVIEPSFAPFLHNALRGGGRQYWLARR
jgi:hypothetical protein